ncbi:MAG: glycosyltransferase [Rhizomicrobium sp.]
MGAPDPSAPKAVLSVIIPARDHARPLKQLLDNLKAQKAVPGWELEVIVAENGSRDDTGMVIAQSGFRRVESTGEGPGVARNAGVRESRGSLLLFLDADACPVTDDFILRVLDAARRLGNFGGFGGPILLPQAQARNPVAVGDHWACWFNWTARRPFMQSRLFQPTVCFAMKREVFDRVGGFRREMLILEDMELQERIMAAGLPIYFVPGLDVTHQARASLFRSWRHSWSWGGSFRDHYLAADKSYGLKYPVGHPRFHRNLAYIFRRRMRIIRGNIQRPPGWRSRAAWWFCGMTVFVWALAVVWGRTPTRSRPI